MRKAKIICTLGPASDSEEILEAMIRAGMDVARLNFSHGTHQEHRRRVQHVRRLAKKLGRNVAVLQDVQGPKIRVGRFEGGKVELPTGGKITLTLRDVLGRPGLVPVKVPSLTKDVKKDDMILLDDGRLRLRALRVGRSELECLVESGGVLKDHKGLNLPGSAMSVPTVTAKDQEDIAFGQELGVDFLALSFVRSADDIRRARALVSRRGTPIVAKIEKPQAVAALEEIAACADGVMIARGDLGVEMPLEKLPTVQKQAVRLVNAQGGVVIVATEMLESMVSNIRPTRAEVTDVANAIFDGADAVMLSGETAAGQHPVLAVETMARIVEEAEQGASPALTTDPIQRTDELSAGVAAAAVAASRQLGIDLIVAYTESGSSARRISELRPEAKILALTPHPEIVRRVALYWGVQGLLVGRLQSTDAMLRQVRRLCAEHHLAARGTPIAIVAGVPLNQSGNTNLMTVHRV